MTGGKLRRAAWWRHQQVLVWHRRLGIFSAAVLVVVVVTGIPLNHVETLGLDRKTIDNEALLEWYGMEPEDAPVGYQVGSGWLIWFGDALFLDDRRLEETTDEVVGVVAVGELLHVAARHEMLVLLDDGSLVERVPGAALPGPIEVIGLSEDDRVTLQTPSGRFSATVDLVEWTQTAAPVGWSRPAQPPPELEARLAEAHRGSGLPWSRLLLDIHSGRILGVWGPYLIDAVAFALLLLVGTGIFNWLRSTRRPRRQPDGPGRSRALRPWRKGD